MLLTSKNPRATESTLEQRMNTKKAYFILILSIRPAGRPVRTILSRPDEFPTPASVMLSTTRLLRQMADIFWNNSLPKAGPTGVQAAF